MTDGGKQLYPVPFRTATIGMFLFLVALSVLFASSLVGYFAIRVIGANSPHGRVLHLPGILWISTAVIIISSYTMSRAVKAVRAERQAPLRANLVYTLVLAVIFTLIQAPALLSLLHTHERERETGTRLYGMLFFLILLHALHVLGGLVALTLVTRNAYRHRYDHEQYTGVRSAAWYWHFLDVVWLVMFLSMWVIG